MVLGIHWRGLGVSGWASSDWNRIHRVTVVLGVYQDVAAAFLSLTGILTLFLRNHTGP